ncbi:MAG: hypothetical protein IIC67_07465 [Thaumarchaeota archaeon]|nr:hypothetical protein [Nitrososphaerota archaeon]
MIRKEKRESELRKNGCKCKIEPLQMLDPEDHDETKQKKSNKKNLDKDRRSDQKKLYDFVLTRIDKLVISENNSDEVFGILKNNNHIETFNLSSTRAVHWLTNEHNQFGNSDELHSSDYYKTILNTIISKATMNGTQKVKVYNRIAQLEKEIWYDLGDSSWQAIKITEGKVKLVKLDKDSPVFRRSQSLQEQIKPQKGSNFSLDLLVNLLHILEPDQLVFKINLICLCLQAYSMPMIVFDGSAGSIKTTATATVKRIVDPAGKVSQDNVSSMQEKPNDLIIQLSNRYLSSFDNVSYIDSKISDVICRGITGSNNERRKLYTDNDEAIFSFRSKIVLNGIIPTLDYPDLQTRLISYDRETIDESNLITEKEFQERLDEILPNVLGIIFKTLAKALQKYPELKDKIKPKTRMADFEIWGEIISRCLGNAPNKFLKEYYAKVNQRNISNQENYPIIQTIQILMKNRTFYEDSALNIFTELSKIAEDKLLINLKDRFIKFPKHYNMITKHLKVIKPLLKTSGFDVINYHWTKQDPKFDKNTSIIRISKIEPQKTLATDLPKKPSLPSLPSLQEKQAQKSKKTSESSERLDKSDSEPSLESENSSHKKQASETSESSESNFTKFSPDLPTKSVIIKNLDEFKHRLRDSQFELWSNGTVKCKLCLSRMDIPSALNHTCQKRPNPIGDMS